MKRSTITVNESNAFVTTFDLPPTGSGSLDGLCFAVKDVIDVAGCKTGCGNPTWRDSHPTAVAHANRATSDRSEEHTSELQSLRHLVCRLLLDKKNLRLNPKRQKPE